MSEHQEVEVNNIVQVWSSLTQGNGGPVSSRYKEQTSHREEDKVETFIGIPEGIK